MGVLEMKRKKNRYRFEITKNLAIKKTNKQYFYVFNDGEAITFLINLLPNLCSGDIVVLSRWDKRNKRWVFMRRGGKDKPTMARTLF